MNTVNEKITLHGERGYINLWEGIQQGDSLILFYIIKIRNNKLSEN